MVVATQNAPEVEESGLLNASSAYHSYEQSEED
jgi:hypothetical protein